MPQFMKEIVAELTHLARRSHDISQRSGVSVRMSVANYENLVSNAPAARSGSASSRRRRASPTWPEFVASTTGKIELEDWAKSSEDQIVDKLIQGAVAASSTATSRCATSTGWCWPSTTV